MIFWRLRYPGLGEARAGAPRRGYGGRGTICTAAPAARCEAARVPGRGHAVLRTPPAAVASGGHGDRRSCHGHGRGGWCGAATQVRVAREGVARRLWAAPRRARDQLGCECGGGVARRQASSGRGSQPSPCPRASRWEAAVAAPPYRLPASGAPLAAPERTRRRPSCRRPEHAQPGWEGYRPQIYSRHAVSLPTAIKG